MKPPELVSKTQAAKRWGVTPPAVTKYVFRGMPVLPNGMLDWAKADAWRRNLNLPERSGSFRARETGKESTGAVIPRQAFAPDPSEDSQQNFAAGYVAGYVHARKSLRKALPGVLATMRPEFVQERIGVFALVDYLLQTWLDDPENEAGKLPLIEWGVFRSGITGKAARSFFELLQAELASGEGADSAEDAA